MPSQFGPLCRVARVRWISDGDDELYVEFRNGLLQGVFLDRPLEVSPGDVVLVRDDGVDVAPAELWTAETWVGVVRRRKGDTALVAGRGDVKIVDVNDVECDEGNTVEVDEDGRIIQKLDDRPVSYNDPTAVDETVIDKFKEPVGGSTLTFDDFGGLEAVKQRAYELVELPLERAEALATIGARPIKGVLFTGAPGTGKTMLARIIANRAEATFYEISGPQIFSKWLGESEAILRRIFEDAAEQPRSIIFFDEIDSVAPQRASDANDASRRVVAQLLTQMDGFKSRRNVIVIAATNRPEDLDSALRRPGRFDWELDFPLPTLTDRIDILRVSADKLQTVESLPHVDVACRTEGWSAAELAGIWSEAALLAVADGRDRILDEDYYGGLDRVGEQRRRLAAELSAAAADKAS